MTSTSGSRMKPSDSACGGSEREAADTGGVVRPRGAREGHCLAVGGDGVHGQFSRFLWKRPAFMIRLRCRP